MKCKSTDPLTFLRSRGQVRPGGSRCRCYAPVGNKIAAATKERQKIDKYAHLIREQFIGSTSIVKSSTSIRKGSTSIRIDLVGSSNQAGEKMMWVKTGTHRHRILHNPGFLQRQHVKSAVSVQGSKTEPLGNKPECSLTFQTKKDKYAKLCTLQPLTTCFAFLSIVEGFCASLERTALKIKHRLPY